MGSSVRRASRRIDPGQSASIGARFRLPLPARIVRPHRYAAAVERMAAVELERTLRVCVRMRGTESADGGIARKISLKPGPNGNTIASPPIAGAARKQRTIKALPAQKRPKT